MAFATNRKVEILKWFDWWPDQNIGIVCSQESGVFGIDVDYSNDGHHSIDLLTKLIGDFRHKSTLAFSGNGYHLYFKHPGIRIPDFHNVLPGIDIRAEKAYLTAPPSLHISGEVYAWEKEKELETFPLPAALNLLKLMRKSEGHVFDHSPLAQKPGRTLKEIRDKFESEGL